VSSAIRVLALAAVRRGDELLVEDGHDPVKDEHYLRLLGGGVDFGERGEDAVRRELHEEIGVELTDVRYLGAVENLFTFLGRPDHEICLLFAARFADDSLYEQDRFAGVDIVDGPEVPARRDRSGPSSLPGRSARPDRERAVADDGVADHACQPDRTLRIVRLRALRDRPCARLSSLTPWAVC
jgi:ADP-ribose pyrophosphatase YjhB (NUDIX family)